MKNTLKKVLSLFTAILMTITLGTTSIHAEPDSTTGLDPTKKEGTLFITSKQNGKTDSRYSVYQVLETLEVPEGQNVYEYQFTDAFKDFKDFNVEDIAAQKSGPKDYAYNAETVDKVATALKAYIDKKAVDGTPIASKATLSNQTKTANLDLGYYLILETTPTEGYTVIKPMLVAIPSQKDGKYKYEVTVELKEQPLSTKKEIVVGENATADAIAQQVGKEYTYRITQDIPKYGATYDESSIIFKLTDTLSKGLDFGKVISVKADNFALDENTNYELTKSDNQDGTTTLTFDFSNGDGKTYYTNIKDASEIVIEYTVKLNKDASFGPTGNPNEVVPEFTHTPGKTTTGDKEITATYAGLLEIQKVGEDGKTGLAGAEFTVYTDEECTQKATLVTYKIDDDGAITEENPELSAIATTDKNGIARFEGLGAGIYYIKETGSPSGYIELDKPIKVTVTVTPPPTITAGTETATFEYNVEGNGVEGKPTIENGKLTFTVKNTKGFTLPTTGGIGTYVFTIGGAVLILAAIVLFVRSRKETK